MTGANPVVMPGLKDDAEAGTAAERRVNSACANDPKRNVFVEEPLRNNEIMSLHGWTINKNGMWQAEFGGATGMQLPPVHAQTNHEIEIPSS